MIRFFIMNGKKSVKFDMPTNELFDIVNITLHNSLKNFEDIGHWNKYPRSVVKWIFIPMRRAGR